MYKNVGLLLFAFFLLAALVQANPILKDVHETNLDLLEAESATTKDGAHYGRFAVKVERIDEVVDEKEKGEVEVEAVRISNVLVSFDVSPSGDVSVNGQVIPLGMSNIQVEADISYGVSKSAVSSLEKAAEIGKAFDVGIVNMAVSVTGETIKDDDVEIARITVAEVITEINGSKVSKSESMQQIIEILPSGEIRKGAPEPASADALKALEDKDNAPHRRPCSRIMRAKFVRWYNHLSPFGKIGVSMLAGGLVGAMLALVTKAIVFVARGCTTTSEHSESTQKLVDSSAYPGEKLPAYDSKGYTAVSVDEKSEEKN